MRTNRLETDRRDEHRSEAVRPQAAQRRDEQFFADGAAAQRSLDAVRPEDPDVVRVAPPSQPRKRSPRAPKAAKPAISPSRSATHALPGPRLGTTTTTARSENRSRPTAGRRVRRCGAA